MSIPAASLPGVTREVVRVGRRLVNDDDDLPELRVNQS